MRYVILLIASLSVVMVGLPYAAKAQTAPATQSYQDVMKACGAEWRASDQRKAVEKGKGREAWNTFRAECVKRHGYVAKRARPAAQ